MKSSKLACPLGEEVQVDPVVINFLQKHTYIDLIKNGEFIETIEIVRRR